MTRAPDPTPTPAPDDLNLDDFIDEARELGLLAKAPTRPRVASPLPRHRVTKIKPLYTPESLCLLVERTRCICGSEYLSPGNVLLWGSDPQTGAARGLAVNAPGGFQDLPRSLRYTDRKVSACPSCFTADPDGALPVDLVESVKLNGDEYHYVYHWTEPFTDPVPPGREKWEPPVPPADATDLDDFNLEF